MRSIFTIDLNLKKKFILIVVFSVGLRLAAACLMGNKVVELPGTFDQISYNTLANRVLNGYGFTFAQDWWPATPAGEQTGQWSFFYVFYLVGVYAVFGPNPLVARIIQSIIVGIIHPLLAYRIGREFLDENQALLAAFLTAFYIYFIYYSGSLMTEPFYITAVLTSFYFTIKITSQKNEKSIFSWYMVALGMALGCTVLLRQLFLLFLPFLLFWIGWCDRQKRFVFRFLEVFLPIIIICIMILPFTIFNYSRFHQFVLLNSNAGSAFFFGNHPIYGTHFIPILPSEMGTYHDLIPKELLNLNEAALDQALLKRAVQFILADPLRYILLSFSRIPAYFQFWPSAGSGFVSNISRIASFGILLPFMLCGLTFWTIRGGLRRFSSSTWLLFMFMIIYTMIHLLTWALIRYRLPVDAILVLFAALGISELYQAWNSSIKYRIKLIHL
jgi:4-amino-4-deoxy-L-arabinose transferase-like glycosyltransferase